MMCKSGKQHKTCSSAPCTMDDASYFLLIRLGPKTSECERTLTVVSAVTGCDVTNCATTLHGFKKHDVKLANTFCEGWDPTRAKTNRLDFWKQSEAQLQKWKIIDHIAVPINWETRSTVARNCCAQNLTDHWPMLTFVTLSEKKEMWQHNSNSVLKGWRPRTESDESGFGSLIVESFPAAEDVMGEVSIEDITECTPKASRTVEFESAGGRNK